MDATPLDGSPRRELRERIALWTALVSGLGGFAVGIIGLVLSILSYNLADSAQAEQLDRALMGDASRVVVAQYGAKDKHIQNFGDMPVLDVQLVLREADPDSPDTNSIEKFVYLGILPPCSEIDISNTESSLQESMESGWNEYIRYTDVNRNRWEREAVGPPRRVGSPRDLNEGSLPSGLLATPIGGCK